MTKLGIRHPLTPEPLMSELSQPAPGPLGQRWREYTRQRQNRTQEIHFYINSPGGSVSSTLAIYDTMQFLECPIVTYCMGMAASGAAILLASGSKGRRHALPHAKVMIHQPWI